MDGNLSLTVNRRNGMVGDWVPWAKPLFFSMDTAMGLIRTSGRKSYSRLILVYEFDRQCHRLGLRASSSGSRLYRRPKRGDRGVCA